MMIEQEIEELEIKREEISALKERQFPLLEGDPVKAELIAEINRLDAEYFTMFHRVYGFEL